MLKDRAYSLFCVKRYGLGLHLKRLRVLPRVCITDLTHIPIAAFSRPFNDVLRALTVFLTFFIQRHNSSPNLLGRAILLVINIFYASLVQR